MESISRAQAASPSQSLRPRTAQGAPAPAAGPPATRPQAPPDRAGSAQWGARQWAILRSDWRNFALLIGQPVVIAALVSWVSDDRALTMFFAYLATLWFGCSNAAQEIVHGCGKKFAAIFFSTLHQTNLYSDISMDRNHPHGHRQFLKIAGDLAKVRHVPSKPLVHAGELGYVPVDH